MNNSSSDDDEIIKQRDLNQLESYVSHAEKTIGSSDLKKKGDQKLYQVSTKSKNFIMKFLRRLKRAYGCEKGCNILKSVGWQGVKRKNGKYVFMSAEEALPEKMKQESFLKKLIIFRVYVTFLFISNLIY